MDYETACEETVTQDQARREVARHQCNWAEFLADVGDRATYKGAEVLAWLGY